MTTYTNRTRRLYLVRGEGYHCQTWNGQSWTFTGLTIKVKADAFAWLKGAE